MEQIYIPKQDYKVLVRCFTYNQSKYIEDSLNGFAMQQTEFPFVCLVMDDCSTDGEQEVIKAWMERECDMVKAEYIDIELSNVIIVPHKSNTSCTFAFYFLKQNLYGSGKKKMNMVYPWRECCKYEALCEGDDYWIAGDKLHKQVNFMNNHPDCGICCTNFMRLLDNSFEKVRPSVSSEIDFIQLLNVNCIGTLTTMYRTKLYNQYMNEIQPYNYHWKMGDYPMWLYFAYHTKVHHIGETTAVYRIIGGSASNPTSIDRYLEYIDSTYEIKYLYIDKYDLPQTLKKKHQTEHHYRRAGVLMKHKEFAKSFKEFKSVTFNLTLFFKYALKLVLNKDI